MPRVEIETEAVKSGRKFAKVHGLFMRAPIVSADAKFIFSYVVTRQRPDKFGQIPKPYCWATMAEMQEHFRTYLPKKRAYTGGSRSRVVDAIKELEQELPDVFTVLRKGGSASNKYMATPYAKWPDELVDRCQHSYDALQLQLAQPVVRGPKKIGSSPRPANSPKTQPPAPIDHGPTALVKEPEDGESVVKVPLVNDDTVESSGVQE